jgi:hypothetical protein
MLLIIAYKPDLTPPKNCSREEARWIRTTSNEEEVTNSNPPLSCVDMSKKKTTKELQQVAGNGLKVERPMKRQVRIRSKRMTVNLTYIFP